MRQLKYYCVHWKWLLEKFVSFNCKKYEALIWAVTEKETEFGGHLELRWITKFLGYLNKWKVL